MQRNRKLKLLADNTQNVYKDLDSAYEKVLKKEEVSCGKGEPCHGCCYQLVQVSISEACLIYDKCEAIVQRYRKRLLHNSDVVAEITREQAKDHLNSDGALELTEDNLAFVVHGLADAYWMKHLRCPFLSDQNRCLIYEHRPIACRTYYVKSDPKLCHEFSDHKVEIESLQTNTMLELRLDLGFFEDQILGPPKIYGPLSTVLCSIAGWTKKKGIK